MSGSTEKEREKARGCIDFIALLLASAGLVVGLLSSQSVTGAETEKAAAAAAVRVHADENWYRSRPEREQRWRGILRERPVVAGPGSRTALGFALETAEGMYPVYSAGVTGVLARFEGQRLEVVGKLVNLADEGLGTELWIATIRPLAEERRAN